METRLYEWQISADRPLKVIEKQIRQYDLEERLTDRTDFLQQLRRKDDPDRANHKRDLMNHLSNNVYEPSKIYVLLQSMIGIHG